MMTSGTTRALLIQLINSNMYFFILGCRCLFNLISPFVSPNMGNTILAEYMVSDQLRVSSYILNVLKKGQYVLEALGWAFPPP